MNTTPKTPTCCRHCVPRRCTTVPTIGDVHDGGNYTQWRDGRCPACHEVVHVVQFIGALADNDGDPDRMNVMADVQSSITTFLIEGAA